MNFDIITGFVDAVLTGGNTSVFRWMLQNEVRDTPLGESVYNFEGKKTEKKNKMLWIQLC